MEELTREEAIRRHRLMWNWIADETEKTGKPVDKIDAFEHFGWDRGEVLSSCWCCEYARHPWQKDEIKCDFCPLDWSVGNNIIGATCTHIPSSVTIEGSLPRTVTVHGLYRLWVRYIYALRNDDYKTNIKRAAAIARTIANLPEKKEVKEND